MDDLNNTNNPPENTDPNNRQEVFAPQQVPDSVASNVPAPDAPAPSTPTSDIPAQNTPTVQGSNASVSVTPAQPIFSNPAEPIPSTDTGDIILSGNAPKTKKKIRPFIIGGIVLVVVAITIIIMLVTGLFGKKYSEGEVQIIEAQKSFSRYANYLLYGEEKDKLEGEYSSQLYMLDIQVLQNEASDYWNKVLELLEQSISDINRLDNIDSEKKDNLINFLQGQYAGIDFLAFYRQVQPPTAEQLVQAYLDFGEEGVTAFSTQLVAPLVGINSEIADSYINAITANYALLAEQLTIYNRLGCLTTGGINDICTENTQNSDSRLNEIINERVDLADYLETTTNDLVRQIESSCWQINSELADIAREN